MLMFFWCCSVKFWCCSVTDCYFNKLENCKLVSVFFFYHFVGAIWDKWGAENSLLLRWGMTEKV